MILSFFSYSWTDHLSHIKILFDLLRRTNLTLNPAKLELAQYEATIHGYSISFAGIRVDPKKLAAIRQLSPPTDLSSLRSFLGMTGFFRSHIRSFSHIAKPLYDLTTKGTPFLWTQECQDAWTTLIAKLSSAPTLSIFNPNLPSVLFVDTSAYAVGGILGQYQDELRTPVVIAFFSKQLSPAEQNFSVSDREMLGIVDSLKHFSHYLKHSKVTLFTDHHAILFYLKLENPKGRTARWLVELGQYDLEIKYLPGKQHPADCLSRIKPSTPPPDVDNSTTIPYVLMIEQPDFRTQLAREQSTDPAFSHIITQIKERPPDTWHQPFQNYSLQYDLLYYTNPYTLRRVLCVPKTLVPRILHYYHEDIFGGHFSLHKMRNRIQRHYYFADMTALIKLWVRSWVICGKLKSRTGYIPGLCEPLALNASTAPFETIMMDLLGPVSASFPGAYTYVALCVDLLTRFIVTFPLRSASSELLAHFLVNQVIFRYGAPKVIVADQASINKSELITNLSKCLGFDMRYTTPHSHNGNLSEIYLKTLQNCLASLIQEHPSQWHMYLPIATHTVNTTVNVAHSFTPFYLLHGYEARTPLELQFPLPSLPDDYLERLKSARHIARTNIIASQENSRHRYNKSHKPISYKPGDLIMVSFPNLTLLGGPTGSRKFAFTHRGPFKILKQLTDLNYEITPLFKDGKPQIVHVKRLKPFTERPPELTFTPQSIPDLTLKALPHKSIEDLADPLLPDSVAPAQTEEDIMHTGYRTRFGRISRPPART